jgi:hypothetical protein
MTVNEFVDALSRISLPNVFNPYAEICDVSDHAGSALIRRRNLSHFLESTLRHQTRSIWLGRDLGYRGGRRTGIALTDEFHLQVLQSVFGVTGLAKATIDQSPMKERTATEVWKLLSRIGHPVLLWNVFPFHPFDEGKPFTNRRHTSWEFDLCRDLLSALLKWLEPTTIVALGGDAEAALLRLGYECKRVRHPSYGGQNEFARAICKIYGLPFPPTQ